MPNSEIEKNATPNVAVSEKENATHEVSAVQAEAGDSVLVQTHKPVRFRTDTFYLSASDFPASAMDTLYLDSCVKDETFLLPTELQEQMTATGSAFDSLLTKLSDVADTTLVFDSQKNVSLKEVYRGYSGRQKPETLQGQAWFIPLLFAVFFGYGLAFALRSKSITRDVKEFFSTHHSTDQPSDQKTQYRFALTLLALVSLSMFVVSAIHFAKPGSGPSSYLAAVAGCTAVSFGYYLFKRLTSAYLSYVFFGRNALTDWVHAFNFLLGGMGILLFPIFLCFIFAPLEFQRLFFHLGVGVAIVAEILLIVFDIRRFFKYKFSILYLFLYLCTLEILPLAAMLAGYFQIIATV